VFWGSKSWAHDEARRAYARAEDLSKKLGEEAQLVAVLLGLVLSATGSGQFKLARELAERMLVVAERSREAASLSAAHTFLGETLMEGAQYIDAQKHLELAIHYCEESGAARLGEWGLLAFPLRAMVVLALGYPDSARKLAEDTLHRLALCTDPIKVGGVRLWLGLFCWMLQDKLGMLEQSRVMAQLSIKEPVWNGLADLLTAKALIIEGDLPQGAKYLSKAIAFNNSVGLLGLLPLLKLDQAEILARQGFTTDAMALVNSIADQELLHVRCQALRLRADLLAESGSDASEVDRHYRGAIECARHQRAKYYELEATTHFARWLKLQRRAKEAHAILAAIYQWFTEGFDTFVLRDAKGLLDELSS
jgi:tetratricopeptide (TPR) repeat protein